MDLREKEKTMSAGSGSGSGWWAIIGQAIVGIIVLSFFVFLIGRAFPDLGSWLPYGRTASAVAPAGMRWEPTVDCAAKGGIRTVNPVSHAPSCFVPSK